MLNSLQALEQLKKAGVNYFLGSLNCMIRFVVNVKLILSHFVFRPILNFIPGYLLPFGWETHGLKEALLADALIQ